MWLLAASVLLGALRAGSAQLILTATDVVEKNDCNETVILPCYVTNLMENNEKVMFVTWKREELVIFSFSGAANETYAAPAFSSAKLLSRADLTKGEASLVLKTGQATPGNYSCEVTEANREGRTRMELRLSSGSHIPCKGNVTLERIEASTATASEDATKSFVSQNTAKAGEGVASCGDENTTPEEKCGSWFLLVERAIIISLLFLVIALCAAQVGVIALKYDMESQRKVGFIVAVVILGVVAGVGTALFVQDGYTERNQAGLGLIVIPAVILVPLQYFMFGIVFDSLPQATLALIGLKILGYIIAVVGFALCVTACPPLHGSVLIAGLAIMAIASLLSLAYVFIMGSRMKDHPRPGKAVEEPLNDAKGVMLE